MNQKQLAAQADRAIPEQDESSRSTALLRRLLVEVLSHASSGHFLLREKGRVIAEVGDRTDALQAEVNIVDTRCYLKAVLGGDTAAGEAFVNGWWTSPDITAVTRFFCTQPGHDGPVEASLWLVTETGQSGANACPRQHP